MTKCCPFLSSLWDAQAHSGVRAAPFSTDPAPASGEVASAGCCPRERGTGSRLGKGAACVQDSQSPRGHREENGHLQRRAARQDTRGDAGARRGQRRPANQVTRHWCGHGAAPRTQPVEDSQQSALLRAGTSARESWTDGERHGTRSQLQEGRARRAAPSDTGGGRSCPGPPPTLIRGLPSLHGLVSQSLINPRLSVCASVHPSTLASGLCSPETPACCGGQARGARSCGQPSPTPQPCFPLPAAPVRAHPCLVKRGRRRGSAPASIFCCG